MGISERERAIAALYEYAGKRWGWGHDEYPDVEAAVDVVLAEARPTTNRGAVDPWEALTAILDIDPVDAALDPDRALRIAREALSAR